MIIGHLPALEVGSLPLLSTRPERMSEKAQFYGRDREEVWGEEVWGDEVWGEEVWGEGVWGEEVWGEEEKGCEEKGENAYINGKTEQQKA